MPTLALSFVACGVLTKASCRSWCGCSGAGVKLEGGVWAQTEASEHEVESGGEEEQCSRVFFPIRPGPNHHAVTLPLLYMP